MSLTTERNDAERAWETELATRAHETGRQYRAGLQRFLDRWGYESLEQLYERRVSDLESPDPRVRKNLEDQVRVLMSERQKEGRAPETCRKIYKSLKAFMKSQGLTFALERQDVPRRGSHNGQLVIQPEQIRELYHRAPEHSRLRAQAQLLILKDTGLKISDVSALNVGDWQDAERLEEPAGTFLKFLARRTVKTGGVAHVVLGPEAFDAVEAYLEERRRKGEDLTDESPLFVDRHGQRVSPQSIGIMMARLMKKLGKAGRKISAHSLRKYHVTKLQTAGFADSWIKKLEGRAVADSFSVYSQPELNGQLARSYIEVYHELQVLTDRSVDVEEVQQLRDRILELETREQALPSLQEKVDRMEKLVDKLLEASRVA